MSVWSSALQCVVVCCFVVVCCGALQLSIAKSGLTSVMHVCELQRVAMCCSQYTVGYCSVLLCNAVCFV